MFLGTQSCQIATNKWHEAHFMGKKSTCEVYITKQILTFITSDLEMRKGLVLASLSSHPANGPTLSEWKALEECKELCVLFVGCHCYYHLVRGLNRISLDEQTVTDNLPGSVILWISRKAGEGESPMEPSNITKASWEIPWSTQVLVRGTLWTVRLAIPPDCFTPGIVEHSNKRTAPAEDGVND